MKAYSILWDVDKNEELENLPNEISIPNSLFYSDSEVISDYITGKIGFCHKGFSLKRSKQECRKLIEDSIKVKLLHGNSDIVLVFKKGIEDPVFVSIDEAVMDLFENEEAQNFVSEKIQERIKEKELEIRGIISMPSFVNENEIIDKFIEFVEDNYCSFSGGFTLHDGE